MGGEGADKGCAISVDESGSVYIKGTTVGLVDFDPGPTVFRIYNEGAFISKFDVNGLFQWAQSWSASSGVSMATYGLESIYVTGHFVDTSDFDPGPDLEELTSNGGSDVYLTRFPPDGEW